MVANETAPCRDDTPKTSRRKLFRGAFVMIELLITIGIAATIIMVIVSLKNILELQQNSYNRTIARQLIIEESESLRNASYVDLHNRAATPFIEVPYQTGLWALAHPAGAHSSPSVLLVQNVTGANNPSRIVVPSGNDRDGTSTAAFRVQPTSPAGWKVGMYIRYHDSLNGYLAQVTAAGLTFSKIVEGVTTQLWSNSSSFSTNTWYVLSINATGPTITISVNGVVSPGTPFADTTFSRGAFLLGAFSGANTEFDDVTFSGLGSDSWDFDSAAETVGNIPRDWGRISVSGLPEASTSITITDAVPGFTDLKQAVLTVSWNERLATRSLTSTFTINQQSVAP